MDCRYIQEQLSWCIDGYLEDDEKQKVEQHLQQCALCAQELEEIKLALATLKELPEVELPPDFQQQLTEKLQKERQLIFADKLTKGRIIKRHWLSWGAAAAVVIFVLVATNIFGMINMDSPLQTGAADNPAEKEAVLFDDAEAQLAKGLPDLPEVPEQESSDGKVRTYKTMGAPEDIQGAEALVKVASNVSADIEVDQVQTAIELLENLVQKYNIDDIKIRIEVENSDSNEATVYLSLPEDIVQKFLDAISSHYKLHNMKKDFETEDENQEKNPSYVKLNLKDST